MNKQEILKLASEFAVGDVAVRQLQNINDYLQDKYPQEFASMHTEYTTDNLVIALIVMLEDRVQRAQSSVAGHHPDEVTE